MDRLKQEAAKFVGDKAWSIDLVLQMGAHLAQAVNSYPGLSGSQKSEWVCQTILTLLDDVEKAEKERGGGSTDSTNSKEPVVDTKELRNFVKNQLPQILHLIVSAARGKYAIAKIQQKISKLLCVTSCFRVNPVSVVPPSQPSSEPLPHEKAVVVVASSQPSSEPLPQEPAPAPQTLEVSTQSSSSEEETVPQPAPQPEPTPQTAEVSSQSSSSEEQTAVSEKEVKVEETISLEQSNPLPDTSVPPEESETQEESQDSQQESPSLPPQTPEQPVSEPENAEEIRF